MDIRVIGCPVRQTPLSAQALTTLGATAGQHQTTALGCHAGAEAMTACADKLRWLKRAFHGSYSWRKTALISEKIERGLLQTLRG
jgi:hypothetical protein